MPEEIITLYSSGSLPGIPGDHAPGTYLVDYEARTIRPAVDTTSEVEETAQSDEVAPQPEQPTEVTPAQEDGMPEVVAVPDLPQETPAQESNQ